MLALELRNVGFEYAVEGETPVNALKGVSFSVEQGEFVCILGANGSGKSTLAKLLNGLLTPTVGTVLVFGKDTTDDTKGGIYEIRSKVGMVFQNPDNQMVASIIEDDIAFGPENLGIDREEIGRRIDWALKVTGMTEFRRHTPYKLSGGQKQRIAIASVLAMKPQVLVLDESTAMLDPQGRREVMEVLTTLNRNEGMTVLHITHHMEEAEEADRVLVMNEGRLTFDGTPKQLFFDKDTVAASDLELPVLYDIIDRLKAVGFDVPEDVADEKGLAEAIWKSK